MNKRLKLIATDLDGTIVSHDGVISQRTIDAFTRAKELGIHIFFVTGRPPRWMGEIRDAFGFGAMYRLGESTGINLYYQINKKMSMGYAFDIPTWGGLAYSYGSHEVMLKFDFNKKEIDIVSPRHY